MVLEVMESVKWVVCLKELNSNPCQDKYETQYTTMTDSFPSFDSGFEGKRTNNMCNNGGHYKTLFHPCDTYV